ncbi:MAG: class I SAM-dependent methyltransferase [Geobacteraceae bacterium]|nr:class I SAM-dependent methyltransferase [Geobacteraceae bacterium]
MKTLEPASAINESLKTRIKHYKKYASDVRNELNKNPQEWGRYQSIFNREVNVVFYQLMEFEREQTKLGHEENIYKLKKLFINHVREEFLYGDLIRWSLEKPYGYAGDFQIIEDIYCNSPKTVGFDRLFDNYFQMSSISVAVRNRKDDFKKCVLDVMRKKCGQDLAVMDLASGPAAEVREIFLTPQDVPLERVRFDCYDNDEHSMEFAKKYLKDVPQVNFFKENAVRLALKKDVSSYIHQKYDVIYSTGLFDYFDYRIAMRLISNLKKMLKPDGLLAISDVRDKFSNPSVHFMEWVGDWNLIYRDDDTFRQIFLDAGFRASDLRIGYEQQGILQYVFASNH